MYRLCSATCGAQDVVGGFVNLQTHGYRKRPPVKLPGRGYIDLDIDLKHQRTANKPNACIHCFKLCCSDRAHTALTIEAAGLGAPVNDQALHGSRHAVMTARTSHPTMSTIYPIRSYGKYFEVAAKPANDLPFQKSSVISIYKARLLGTSASVLHRAVDWQENLTSNVKTGNAAENMFLPK